jgi:dolichyl-phosphate beta-glucosyltransferase
MTKCLVVIPAYNEALRFDSSAYETFGRQVESSSSEVGFLFVDDGSTDQTYAILTDFCASFPKYFAIHRLEKNVGKAEAVRRGMLKALDQGAEVTGYLDADLATPLQAVESLYQELTKNPAVILVMGSRVKLLGRDIERKAYRHYIGRVFATFASLTLDLAVYDTQCGAKLFRASNELRSVFASKFMSRWIFDVEILARMTKEFGRLDNLVIEYPLRKWHEIKGSKLRLRDFLKAALELYCIWMSYSKFSKK